MKPVRYDCAIAFRAQPEIVAMVHEAAREAGVKPSQFIRSAISMALTISGFDTTQIADKDGK